MLSIEDKLLRAIEKRGPGSCFTPRDFLHLGSPEATWQALARLHWKHAIRRLAHGLYDYPRNHPEIGPLSPSPEAVALAIAERDGSRTQPSGAYAASLPRLTDQVPAKVEFLTNGPTRRVRIGTREIVLKNTVPRNMATAGRMSGTVIQALRHLGIAQITPAHIARLGERLNDAEKAQLREDSLHAPAWLRPILRQIARGEE